MWLPAACHPSVNPNQFKKWMAEQYNDHSPPTTQPIPQRPTAKRSKSFVERVESIVVDPSTGTLQRSKNVIGRGTHRRGSKSSVLESFSALDHSSETVNLTLDPSPSNTRPLVEHKVELNTLEVTTSLMLATLNPLVSSFERQRTSSPPNIFVPPPPLQEVKMPIANEIMTPTTNKSLKKWPFFTSKKFSFPSFTLKSTNNTNSTDCEYPKLPVTELPCRLELEKEKFIYRASYAKLSNPKRTLEQQVRIVNLMYYIVSVHADVTLSRGPKGIRKRLRKNSKRVGSLSPEKRKSLIREPLEFHDKKPLQKLVKKPFKTQDSEEEEEEE
jgi:hypothetical protein